MSLVLPLSPPLSLGIDYKFQQWGVGGVGQGSALEFVEVPLFLASYSLCFFAFLSPKLKS